jgi:hypothetical protein
LYGLFECETATPESMMAGLAMHDLETFSQTCAQPDLSYLPARSVLEFSDLWSLSRGAGMLAWLGAAVPVRRLKAQALLVYLAAKPFDNTGAYTGTGWVKAGTPVRYPYLEMLDGQKIWSQPMVLEGWALQKLIKVASRIAIKSSFGDSVVQLKRPFGFGTSSEGSEMGFVQASNVRRLPWAPTSYEHSVVRKAYESSEGERPEIEPGAICF